MASDLPGVVVTAEGAAGGPPSPQPQPQRSRVPSTGPPTLAQLAQTGGSFRRSRNVMELSGGIKRSISKLGEVNADETRKRVLEASGQELRVFAEMPKDDVLKQLGVDPFTGLSQGEAEKRILLNGKNALEKDPPTPLWKMFLEQFTDLLVIMLITASIVSAALGQYAASCTIIAIVLANAVLGVVQESRAGAALEALQSLSAPTSQILRDGKLVQVSSDMLVPGDIILLETGNKVPADIRLVEAQACTAVEMALTGEAEGVKKRADHIPSASSKASTSGDTAGAGAAVTVNWHASNGNGNGSNASTSTYKDNGPTVTSSSTHTNSPPVSTLSIPDSNDKELSKNSSSTLTSGAVTVTVDKDRSYSLANAASMSMSQEHKHREEKKEETLTDPTMVYMGCEITDGRGKGVVVKTGMRTKMGEIAKLLKESTQTDSPLEIKLDKLGKTLGLISITLSLVVFIIGVTTERGSDPTSKDPIWLQMLLVAVSLTVAAVPVICNALCPSDLIIRALSFLWVCYTGGSTCMCYYHSRYWYATNEQKECSSAKSTFSGDTWSSYCHLY